MRNLIVWTFLVTASAADKLKRQVGYGASSGGGGNSGSYGSSGVVGYSGNSGGSGGSLPGYGMGGGGGGGGVGYASGSSSFGQYSNQNVIPAQNPNVFAALDQLRGSEALSATQIQGIIAGAYPGTSYPTLSYIPQTSFSCSSVRQFGFYADPETRCQVFRRCEANNYMFSYICPNGTLFNQITLVCDWWYNVNCPNSVAWVDYSNPRIYRQDLRLFDDLYGNGYGGGSAGYGGGSGSSGYSSGGSSGYSSGGGGGSYGNGGGGSYAGQGSSSVYRSASSEPILEAAASDAKSLREILAQLAAVKTPPGPTPVAVAPELPKTAQKAR
ncbi:hypothetical protein BV898_02919 [Hypsibius exemplaris]|uniref:Chitin-binding type-2 domain-containing protein n=1 Tax=Hypsibius exemplaris TaxID=2072580 RepID=A0A1W0X6L2_HYPEX|nr:hypothetical protein BV898_02919 [Hypsibius exemplaris]